DRIDVGRRQTSTATDLPRLREGGVAGQFWSVYAPSNLPGDLAVTQTLEQVDFIYRLVGRYAGDLTLARTADDVEAAMTSGRIASLLGAEGGQSIGCSLGALRVLHGLGLRYLTLTHNDNTPWADSATDTAVHGGLSRFGVEVVREMNRLGVLVDLSHVSVDTMRAALVASDAPVIFSHSCARAVTDVVRNVPDGVLLSMAASGGVCMVAFVPEFLTEEAAAWRAEAGAHAAGDGISASDFPRFMAWSVGYTRAHPKPLATVDDVVRHVEHVRDVAGIDHVGLGGDYDGTDTMPVGMEDVSGYPRLLDALAERGWSDEDLAKLAHRNTVRVLRDAESVARDLSARRAPSLATIGELDGIPVVVGVDDPVSPA
ncbi:MAG: dipeptidase, partial [Actinomycetota bacterium]|nr:dipeptidase [Actinomycetota bacterium]